MEIMYWSVGRSIIKIYFYFSSGGHVVINFGRGHHEDYFEYEPLVQEMPFKDISHLELWWLFVKWSGTICVILGEGIMSRLAPV